MNFSTIFIVLSLILVLYYTGMIVYDLYFHDVVGNSPAPAEETEIDISQAAEEFDSVPVDAGQSLPEVSNDKPMMVSPVEAGVLRDLMEKVDLGEEVTELEGVAMTLYQAS